MATVATPETTVVRDPHRWWTLAVTSLAMLLIGLDTTVLNVALPTLSEDLHASTSQLQWFADAYLLVLASLLLPAGMLGDRWGRRPLMLAALTVFGLGSAWCAYAGSPGSLIAARAFLGLGAALLIPLAFSLLVVLFDRDERPKAMAVLGLSTMIGMPLGPIIGGELLRHFWWGSVFVMNVPVAAVALVASWWLLPRERPAARPPIDLVGVALSSIGLVSLTFGLIEGPSRGWGSPLVGVTIVVGLLLTVAFLRWERSVTGAEPLLDRSLWWIPEFRWGALAASLASVVGFVALFTAPLYLQAILGTDALGTGLRLLPMLGGLMLGFVVAVRLATVTGPRLPMAIGFVAVIGAAALGATTRVDSGYGATATWLAVFGVGFGMVLISGQNLAVDILSTERAAAGGALIQVMRQVSSVLGIAALVSVLNTSYRGSVDVSGLPAEAADAVKDSVSGGLAVAARLGSPDLATSVKDAFVSGMSDQMWVTCALAVVGLVLTLWKLPNTRPGEADLEDR
ncbi:MAG: DHA2 family efflux MFS transporter permease subunit [Nocardioidaceae bacterium]|nr:DHA2 family efflux MFS transporter permease subunit [Nocardioidaceae bacterium]